MTFEAWTGMGLPFRRRSWADFSLAGGRQAGKLEMSVLRTFPGFVSEVPLGSQVVVLSKKPHLHASVKTLGTH